VGVTGPHWVRSAIRGEYVVEGEYQRLGVPGNNESDAAYGGKHNIFTDGQNGTSGIYWKSDPGARSIVGAVFDKWAGKGTSLILRDGTVHNVRGRSGPSGRRPVPSRGAGSTPQ
jgi:hypothetical protein